MFLKGEDCGVQGNETRLAAFFGPQLLVSYVELDELPVLFCLYLGRFGTTTFSFWTFLFSNLIMQLRFWY